MCNLSVAVPRRKNNLANSVEQMFKGYQILKIQKDKKPLVNF